MTEEDKAKKLEIIKILRKETGVAISLCNEAAKESNNNLEEAMLILRAKCIVVGEKFYKNPERKILFTAVDYRNIELNHLHLVKIGCQSDFLIAADTIKNIASYLIFKKHFNHFTEQDLEEIESELKYQSGLVKENIQLLALYKITKKENENFYIFSNLAPSNSSLFGAVTVVVYQGDLKPNEDQHHQLSINIHSYLKKKIVNIEEENGKQVNYTCNLQNEDLENFLNSNMVTDRTKSINNYLKEISENVKITHIFAI